MTRIDPPAAFACRLCGGARSTPIRAFDAKARRPLPVSLCDDCALVQQTVLPTDEALRIWYSHHYRRDYKSTIEPRPKHVRRAGLAALDRLRFLDEAAGGARGRRLVDIGAGGGEFVYLASRGGYAARGLEPNVGYSDFARRHYDVDVRTAGIEQLEAGCADLVTMFHVLEHLADPGAAFARMHAALADDGRVFVEVPNILQADASPHNVYFKAHLFYFSRFTLAAFASRHFEVERVEDRGNLRMLLRRRPVPLAAPVLPGPDALAQTRARLARKGWVEYLVAGGGLAKPVRRVRRMIAEARLGAAAPRSLLDRLAEGAPARQV